MEESSKPIVGLSKRNSFSPFLIVFQAAQEQKNATAELCRPSKPLI